MLRPFLSIITLVFFLNVYAQNLHNAFELRLLNHWDNPNGTVERGYAGKSIWKWELIPAGEGSMPDSLRMVYEEYGRLNKEYGINGTVLNNVNAKPMMLSSEMLGKTAKIADILRPYGVKVYLSVNFASPKALGDVDTADPLNADVQKWWKNKADEIYRLIPDFGGFLVKANSEGEPGPMDYDRTHVDGANMLADALAPHNGIVMWRAFVYSAKGGDRASQAYEEFVPFDGQFRDNVIIQIKNGPIDFQPLEPVSPLFYALKKTKMMLEVQITQEYTGNSIQTCYLAPMWKETIDDLQKGNASQNIVGIAGVANIGDCGNWTANPLAMANWYAFGRIANDTSVSSAKIASDYLTKYWNNDKRFVEPMTSLLLQSRKSVTRYMMPLGLHHIFAGGHHYGPEPWCAPAGWREDWLPRYYHKADSIGVGFNRTDHYEASTTQSTGSGNTQQYPEPYRSMYNDMDKCPEELLLWFHHVPWQYNMKNGKTLWVNLCNNYDQGVREAQSFVKTWKKQKKYVDPKIYQEQLWRFERQAKDAQWWRDACVLYFQQFSKMPLPKGSSKAKYSLETLMNYHLDIDNYTAPDPKDLPAY